MRIIRLLVLPYLVAAGQELLAASENHYAASTAVQGGTSSRAEGVEAQEAAFANISGTYKGSWQRLKHNSAELSSPLVENESGSSFLRITAMTPNSAGNGLQSVKGEVIIRDGDLHSEDDLVLHLHGVYIPGSRRIHGVLQPSGDAAKIALQPHDFSKRSPAYRQALLHLAEDWMQDGQEWEELPDSELLRKFMDPMKKQCDFVLDVAVQTNVTSLQSSSYYRPVLDEAPAPSMAPGGKKRHLVLDGTMHSDDCGLAVHIRATSTPLDVYYAKTVRYGNLITVLSIAQIQLLQPQILGTSTPAVLSKVSLLTIGQQAIMDAYLCLLHLTIGIMVEPLFNWFAIAAFAEFLAFATYEMRYILMIWRVRRSSTDPWSQQRDLSILYARFYSALLVVIFISYQMQRWMQLLLLGMFSFWIPQIVLCAYQDARQPLKPYFVIGTSIVRLTLPLYFYGCPHNLLRNPTSPTFCLVLSAYVAGQALVLLGQSYFGPRFFIPKQYLPPKYDYHRPAACKPRDAGENQEDGDIETGDAGAECVICMDPVDLLTPQARMITPCNHVFHPMCLQRWMDVKLECPTCRAPLPLV